MLKLTGYVADEDQKQECSYIGYIAESDSDQSDSLWASDQARTKTPQRTTPKAMLGHVHARQP
jgi:hypothetical protein